MSALYTMRKSNDSITISVALPRCLAIVSAPSFHLQVLFTSMEELEIPLEVADGSMKAFWKGDRRKHGRTRSQ
jgi:hypothetical protein